MDYELLAGGEEHCETKPWCPSVNRAVRVPGKLAIVGDRIAAPSETTQLGVGPGEVALLIDEALILEAADEIRRRSA
jgi:hypothetical protein